MTKSTVKAPVSRGVVAPAPANPPTPVCPAAAPKEDASLQSHSTVDELMKPSPSIAATNPCWRSPLEIASAAAPKRGLQAHARDARKPLETPGCSLTPTAKIGALGGAEDVKTKVNDIVTVLNNDMALGGVNTNAKMSDTALHEGRVRDILSEIDCLTQSLSRLPEDGARQSNVADAIGALKETRSLLCERFDAWSNRFKPELLIGEVAHSQDGWMTFVEQVGTCPRHDDPKGVRDQLERQLKPLLQHLAKIGVKIGEYPTKTMELDRAGMIKSVLINLHNDLAKAANALLPPGSKPLVALLEAKPLVALLEAKPHDSATAGLPSNAELGAQQGNSPQAGIGVQPSNAGLGAQPGTATADAPPSNAGTSAHLYDADIATGSR